MGTLRRPPESPYFFNPPLVSSRIASHRFASVNQPAHPLLPPPHPHPHPRPPPRSIARFDSRPAQSAHSLITSSPSLPARLPLSPPDDARVPSRPEWQPQHSRLASLQRHRHARCCCRCLPCRLRRSPEPSQCVYFFYLAFSNSSSRPALSRLVLCLCLCDAALVALSHATPSPALRVTPSSTTQDQSSSPALALDLPGDFLDTSHVPCKFFRQGACQAGNACPFSHDLGAASETVCKYFAKVSSAPLLYPLPVLDAFADSLSLPRAIANSVLNAQISTSSPTVAASTTARMASPSARAPSISSVDPATPPHRRPRPTTTPPPALSPRLSTMSMFLPTPLSPVPLTIAPPRPRITIWVDSRASITASPPSIPPTRTPTPTTARHEMMT